MSDVIQGDLADELPVEHVPRFLPPAVSRELAESIAAVLVFAQARGLDADVMADRVVVLIAPLLVDKDFQLEQVRAALSALVDDANRLAEIAGRRAEQMRRLRAELWLALADAEGFRALTPQVCPAGNAHTGWYAPSNGVQHPCPWCLIDERADEVERLRAHIAECHRLQNNVAAVVGVETDWDAAGRKAVLDAVCRMSGNLADACRPAGSSSDGGS